MLNLKWWLRWLESTFTEFYHKHRWCDSVDNLLSFWGYRIKFPSHILTLRVQNTSSLRAYQVPHHWPVFFFRKRAIQNLLSLCSCFWAYLEFGETRIIRTFDMASGWFIEGQGALPMWRGSAGICQRSSRAWRWWSQQEIPCCCCLCNLRSCSSSNRDPPVVSHRIIVIT